MFYPSFREILPILANKGFFNFLGLAGKAKNAKLPAKNQKT
jgi:hypothetical protein